LPAAGLLILLMLQACVSVPPPEEAAEKSIGARYVISDRSHLDAEYVIDGQPVVLIDGRSEVQLVPGAASRVVTRYFGNELRHDLDGDGVEDVVFLVTREAGGSGVHFYVVAALAKPGGPVGSHGLLLGDRIAPQSIERGPPGRVIVNFAERAPGESFAVPPSIGKTLWLHFDPAMRQFGELVRDFEGEADPSSMTLQMHRWTWVKLTLADGSEEKPADAPAFTLEFQPGGRLSATTDCNVLAGEYVVDGHRLGISELAATRMYCEGSQEAWFSGLLRAATGFGFTGKGELIINLGAGGGSMTFR
jgi:heat shock protein HslJ